MTTRITAAPGADGTPENSLTGLVYALSLPVDAVMVEVCRRPGVPGYAPASLTDLFLPWEAVRRTVSSLSDVVLYRPVGGGGQYGLSELSDGPDRPAAEPSADSGRAEAPSDGEKPRNAGCRTSAESGIDAEGPWKNGGGPEETAKASEKAGTAEAVREPAEPVTLREVFRRAAPHPPIKIHCCLRDAGLEEAVCALALEYALAGRLILSGRLDLSLCGGGTLVGQVAEVYVSPEDQLPSFYRGYREIPGYDAQAARQLAELCARCGSATAHIRQDVVTRRFVEMLSARGIGVSAWTVDEAEELRWFLSAGAADLCTRNLAPALALRG